SFTTLRRTGVAGLAVAVALVAGACSGSKTEKGLVIGKSTSTTTALPAPDIIEDPTTTTADNSTTTGVHRTGGGGGGGGSGPAVRASTVGIPDGSPYGEAIPFTSSVEVPTRLVWILAIGSDARPGGDIRKSNGDSLHLIGVDPQTGVGTILGFPRDSWVAIPGHGTGKINSALAMGGPTLMAQTIRQLTGLPVDYYVVTGFEGFQQIVDDPGLRRWVGVLLRHAALGSPHQQLLQLAALARRLDPSKLTNVVVPGRVGTAGAASVVYLTDEARKIFLDVRPDAAIGGPSGDQPRPAPTTTTTTAPTTTTTAPATTA